MAQMNYGRTAVISIGALLGLGYLAGPLAINGLTTAIPVLGVKINEVIAVAIGSWAGTWVADQFAATR